MFTPVNLPCTVYGIENMLLPLHMDCLVLI